MNTPDELKEMVVNWLKIKQQRGRPTCPCGFSKGPQTIRAHRIQCPAWNVYCQYMRKTTLPTTRNQPTAQTATVSPVGGGE